VVAFNRAASAVGSDAASLAGRSGKLNKERSNSGRPPIPHDSAKDAYLRRLKQSQR